MFRYLAYASILMPAVFAGCAARTPISKEVSMKSAEPLTTALVVQELKPLDLGKPLSTKQVIRINITYGEIKWTAYVGPNPGQTEPAEVTLESFSAPALGIFRGWIYASGKSPTGKTKRVKAGTIGTTIVVQHDGSDDGGIHRVVFIAKNEPDDRVDVVLDGKPETRKTLNQVGMYFEIGPGDTEIPPAKLIATDPEVKALVEQLQAKVETAKLE